MSASPANLASTRLAGRRPRNYPAATGADFARERNAGGTRLAEVLHLGANEAPPPTAASGAPAERTLEREISLTPAGAPPAAAPMGATQQPAWWAFRRWGSAQPVSFTT